MALQLCAKVRWRGPGWAALLPGPALTELGLGLSPCKAAISTSKGQPRDALKVFGHKSICSGPRQTLFGQINEQRTEKSG